MEKYSGILRNNYGKVSSYNDYNRSERIPDIIDFVNSIPGWHAEGWIPRDDSSGIFWGVSITNPEGIKKVFPFREFAEAIRWIRKTHPDEVLRYPLFHSAYTEKLIHRLDKMVEFAVKEKKVVEKMLLDPRYQVDSEHLEKFRDALDKIQIANTNLQTLINDFRQE